MYFSMKVTRFLPVFVHTASAVFVKFPLDSSLKQQLRVSISSFQLTEKFRTTVPNETNVVPRIGLIGHQGSVEQHSSLYHSHLRLSVHCYSTILHSCFHPLYPHTFRRNKFT